MSDLTIEKVREWLTVAEEKFGRPDEVVRLLLTEVDRLQARGKELEGAWNQAEHAGFKAGYRQAIGDYASSYIEDAESYLAELDESRFALDNGGK